MSQLQSSISKSAWDFWQMKTARTWTDIKDTFQSVGYAELDEDHLNLIDLVLELNTMIDELHESSFSLDFIYRIAEVCDRLQQRLVEHFEREEGILQELNYPNLQVHHEQHQKILRELETLIEDLTEGKFAVNLDFKNQILEWTQEHLYNTDNEIFNPKNIAMFLFQCNSAPSLKKWLPKLGIQKLDLAHLEITSFLMELLHHKKGRLSHIHHLMSSCFMVEEFFLKKYLPESPIVAHTKKHAELLSITKNDSTDLPLEKIYQLWLSHLLIRDKIDFDVELWWEGDFFNFMKSKTPSKNTPHESSFLKVAEHLQDLSLLLEHMVNLGKNESVLEDYLLEYKKTQLELTQSWETLFENEKGMLLEHDSQRLEPHLEEHQDFLDKAEHLILMIESHQFALASYHQNEWINQWCKHHLIRDELDFLSAEAQLL